MNLRSLILAPTTLTLAGAGSIDHDKVQPFPQPKPVTVAENAAINFKPSLDCFRTCRPYPAVNAAGETSGGLKGTGGRDSACKGSGLGSQVYGRSGWHEDMWAIMYAWYFPKDVYRGTFANTGFRHHWVNAVVWLDNPALEKPTIVAVSVGGADGVLKNVPSSVCQRSWCPPPFTDYINGTSPMVVYADNDFKESSLGLTTEKGGEFQDLITWEQLPEEARDALSMTDFGESKVPFIDANFEANLKAARPFL